MLAGTALVGAPLTASARGGSHGAEKVDLAAVRSTAVAGSKNAGSALLTTSFWSSGEIIPYPYHNIPFVKSVPFTRTHSIALGRSPRHRKSSCAQSAIIRKSTVTSADIRASSNI
jgi:hypothetical protein